MKKEHKEIVDTLLEETGNIAPDRLKEILNTPEDKLIGYQSTLGMHIRNRFKLWEVPWEEELDDEGVDCSPNHPDAISGEIIKEWWRRLRERYSDS